jgi:hypothetical protein
MQIVFACGALAGGEIDAVLAPLGLMEANGVFVGLGLVMPYSFSSSAYSAIAYAGTNRGLRSRTTCNTCGSPRLATATAKESATPLLASQ